MQQSSLSDETILRWPHLHMTLAMLAVDGTLIRTNTDKGCTLSTRPEVIKLFSCSTQLSTKFQLLIKTITTNEEVSCLSLSDVVFLMLINVKMPTIIGILTFMSRINFVLS